MDHGGISGQDHQGALAGIDPGTFRQRVHQAFQRLYRGAVQVTGMIRPFHGIGDAGQNIASVGALSIDSLSLPCHGTGIQIHQLHDDGGGTIVHRQTVVMLSRIPGFYVGNGPIMFPAHQRNGDIKIRLSAQRIKLSQNRQRDDHMFEPQMFQRQADAFFIAGRRLFRGHFEL